MCEYLRCSVPDKFIQFCTLFIASCSILPFLMQLEAEQSHVIKQCLLYGAAHYGTLLHHYLVLQNTGVLQALMLAQIAAHVVRECCWL